MNDDFIKKITHIEELLTLLVLQNSGTTFSELFINDKHIKLFLELDGEKSSRDLEKITSLSKSAINARLKVWEQKFGIVEKQPNGKLSRLISFEKLETINLE